VAWYYKEASVVITVKINQAERTETTA
jgi:hypothetical protein